MSLPPLRLGALAVAIMLGTSCSKSGPQQGARDAHDTADVSATAAPGVAWQYAYDFQLPDQAISAVQEAHAARCESLGVTRCRITGLRYTVDDDDAVSAMLQVKLEPSIARQFGQQATSIVAKADGRLSNMEFEGEDTAPASSQAARAEAEANRRIADIQRQLGNPALKDVERAQLQQQLASLRSDLGSAQATVAATQEKLATTPMTFTYYGKGGISGFAGHNPVMDAVRSFVSSLVAMITITLQVLAFVLPWAILILLIYLLVRSRPARAVRRFFKRESDEGESSE
jgi:hypothetical protein